jgi:hypothetical protein
MMDRKLATILMVTVLVLSSAPAWAVFENVMISPRARAMGEAGVAVPDAPFAAYVNPAGLAETPLGTGHAGLSYLKPFGLEFNQLAYIGAAQNLSGRLGSVGFGLRQYKVEFRDVDLMKETAFTFSHGLYLYRDFHSLVAAGYGVNVYRLEFAETVTGIDPGSGTAVGVDLALLAVLHDRTRIGVMVHNVNVPKIGQDQEEIPQRIRMGASYRPYAGVTTTFEAQIVQGDPTRWHGGLELEVIDGFHLRAGIATDPSKLGAGFGYTFKGFSLDYGFITGGGVLDSSHQFGLRATWGGEAQ